MADQGSNGEGDDLLLGRLREATSGDAAVRQLRRRYDLLRNDYEQLLDRLGDLEDRLNEPASSASTPPAPPIPTAAEERQEGVAGSLRAPLLRLRDDYLAAVAGIQEIVAGLEGLAAGAFKGQHAAPGVGPVPSPPVPVAAHRPRKVQVEVRGTGFGELLDFQERLSSVAGVARVSINAIDNERATLVVELHEPDA